MLASIRSLVLRSVEGLSHDTVYVSLFPAEPPLPARGLLPYAPVLGLSVPRGVAVWLTPLLWGLLIGTPLLLDWLFCRYRTSIRQDSLALRSPPRSATTRRRMPTSMPSMR